MLPLYSPKGPLSYFCHFFIFGELVTEGKFYSIVVFRHYGGLPVGPEEIFHLVYGHLRQNTIYMKHDGISLN